MNTGREEQGATARSWRLFDARSWRPGVYVWLLLAMLLLGACRSAFLGRAERDYTEGRYLEVAEALARYEDRLHKIPRAKQARYGLYRGLALLKLGDYEGTAEWFAFVKDIERAGPTLDPERQALFEAGQRELAAMLRLQSGEDPGAPGPAQAPTSPGPAPGSPDADAPESGAPDADSSESGARDVD